MIISCNKVVLFFIQFCLLLSPLHAGGVSEGEFAPDSKVEIVVPASTGGGSEIIARALAETMQKTQVIHAPIVVEYKPGGSGAAAISYANSRAHSDQVLFVANTSHILRMMFDTGSLTLTPIARMAVDPILVVVPAESPFHSLAELVSAAQERRVFIGTADTLDRYCVELLRKHTSGDFRSIYYNGAGYIVTGMTHGQLDGGILNPSEAREGIATGELRPIVAFSKLGDSDLFPSVPTFEDLGYHGMRFQLSRYVMGPAGMSDQAVDYWNGVLQQVANSKEWMSSYLVQNRLVGAYLGTDEARAYIELFELPWIADIKESSLVQ